MSKDGKTFKARARDKAHNYLGQLWQPLKGDEWQEIPAENFSADQMEKLRLHPGVELAEGDKSPSSKKPQPETTARSGADIVNTDAGSDGKRGKK